MPDPEPTGEIAVGRFRVRGIPRWLLVFVILVALVAGGAYGWRWLHSGDLVSARQANDSLRRDILEYGRHIAEDPEFVAVLMDDVRGKLTAKRYSDDCIVLARKHPNGRTHSKLVVHFDEAAIAPEGTSKEEFRVMLPLYAAQRVPKCLNPHPGRFDTWNGNRNGCWLDVWRQWPDGCRHVQGYNVCENYWDANHDGTPRVRWTNCAH